MIENIPNGRLENDPFPPEKDDKIISGIRKSDKIVLIILIGLVVLMILNLLLSRTREKSYEKILKKEMQALADSVNNLKKERIKLEENAARMSLTIDGLVVKNALYDATIADQKNQLKKIQSQYEKINSYVGITNDSLRRIFAERFGN